MTNRRYLVSRNKREGWYAGKKRFYYLPFAESDLRKYPTKGKLLHFRIGGYKL